MKNLILLQENSGRVAFLNSIADSNLRNLVRTGIDGLAENFESIKTSLQLRGYYDQIINLTDVNCTKAKLLAEMIKQTRAGNVFDLLILGHGGPKTIALHGSETLTDVDIANLLTQARQQHAGINFNLRLVYMCNCFSGSLLDSWLSIGAKTALGCDGVNFMPEPQITYFFDDFVKKNFNAVEANNRSFTASDAIWSVLSLPASKRTESKLRVKGANIKFEGIRLTVGETVTKVISANAPYNFTNLYLVAGERYQFTVAVTDKWKNGFNETNAKGYTKGLFDVPRQPSYKMLQLVGEIFNENRNSLSYSGIHFGIGTSKTWDVSLTGFLVCHANDGLVFYGDNSGSVTVTIKRIS
jgi:hypothetical protein